jgi:hypothetical protein
MILVECNHDCPSSAAILWYILSFTLFSPLGIIIGGLFRFVLLGRGWRIASGLGRLITLYFFCTKDNMDQNHWGQKGSDRYERESFELDLRLA